MTRETIERELDKLIVEGHALLKTARASRGGGLAMIDDSEGVRRWSNHLLLFRSVVGDLARPWASRLSHNGVVLVRDGIEQPLSALEMMKYALEEGLLTKYEDIVYAETFTDLFQQGDHLLEQGYFLASGVIFRAVLEERLRRMCSVSGCMPSKTRPSIHDLNLALYGNDPPVYDKSMMFHVSSLAAIGNDAAHNKPELRREDVDRLRTGLLGFLGRFSA